jgi:hypothetical protein
MGSVAPLPSFLPMVTAAWAHRRQLIVIEFLQAENRLLKDRLRGKRIRFSDAERALLAIKAKAVGRKARSNWTRSFLPILCCVGTDGCWREVELRAPARGWPPPERRHRPSARWYGGMVIVPPSGSPCDDAGRLARVLPLRVRRLIAPPCIERFKSPGPTVRRGCQRFRSSTFHPAIIGMH